MLPLAFSALVWPARRIWAARLVELLIALILSKFVIVAVLSLAGAALGQAGAGPSILLPAMALVFLATFSPWAVLRILPFAELAAGAAGSMRSAMPSAGPAKDHLLKRASGLGEAEALSLPEPLTVARPFGNDPPESDTLQETGRSGRSGPGGDRLGEAELTPAPASFGHAPSQTSTAQTSTSQASTNTGGQPAAFDYAAIEHAGGGGGQPVGTGAQPARPSGGGGGGQPHSEPAPPSYDEVPPYKKPGLVVLGGPTGAYHVPDPKDAANSGDDDLPPLSAPSDPL
jgi:hypothetical protein